MLQNYLKVVMRNLTRHKGYSFINLLGLAVGMTCCILILLYIQDEFSYDRYHEQPDQLYRVVMSVSSADRGDSENARTPPAWAPVLAERFPEIESYVRIKAPLVSWLVANEAANKRFNEPGFYFADATIFDVFNFKMIQGDPATALREPNTVVITASTAGRYFGDEDPMGKTLRLDNAYDLRVTGILEDVPENTHMTFGFLGSFETLNANAIYGGQNYGQRMQSLGPEVYAYFRLEEGYGPESFEQKMPAFIEEHYKDVLTQFNTRVETRLQPVTDIHLHSNLDRELRANSDISYIYIFSAIALFILMIASINYMNLATARSAGRAREVGIRKVLGAYRSQMMIQFIGESVIMAMLAVLLSIGMVYTLLPMFNALSGKELALSISDPGFLSGIFGIVVLVGILSGSYPALFLSAFQPVKVLKGASKGGSGNINLRRILVVLQFAISIIFIIGTGVVADQMRYVQNKNLGFQKEQMIVIPLGDPRARVIFDSYKQKIIQHPSVLGVTATDEVPGGLIDDIGIQPEGAPDEETVRIDNLWVEHDFIKTYGVELIEGRDFSMAFPTDTLAAFILNEEAVRYLGWEGEALDKRIRIGNNFKDGRVIGVVRDFHVKSLHNKIEPLMLHIPPTADLHHYFSIRIGAEDIPGTLEFLEQKWYEVYPLDSFVYSFLDEDFDSQYRTEQLREQVFWAFSALAIFIACLGLLGLASFTAEQRTREIGIRKVMGATVPGIITLLTSEFVKLVAISNLIAWPVAYYVMNGWLQNFAYSAGISLWIFIIAALVAMAITVATVSYQAFRAAMINPADALAYE